MIEAVRDFESSHPAISVVITHSPYHLDPYAPRFGIPADAYRDKIYGPAKASMKSAGIPDFATEHGLSLTPNGFIGHTERAHRASLFAHVNGPNESERKVSHGLYELFWKRGGDITSREQLADVLADAGYDRARALAWLESDEGVAEVSNASVAFRDKFQQRGVRGVPQALLTVRDGSDKVVRTETLQGSKSVEEWKQALEQLSGRTTLDPN